MGYIVFKRILILSFLVSSLTSMASYAVPTHEGFYAGLSLGGTYSQIDAKGAPEKDENDFGYKITGGYRLNRNIALEFAYADLGEVSFGDSSVKVKYNFRNTYTAGVVGILPLADRLEGFGRLGLYSVQSELGGSAFGVDVSLAKKRYTGANLGLGLNYELAPQLSFRGEWEYFSGVKTPSYSIPQGTIPEDKGDINLITVGLSYKF